MTSKAQFLNIRRIAEDEQREDTARKLARAEIVCTQTALGTTGSSQSITAEVIRPTSMIVTEVQDQAIAARMALIVGADRFDRLFRAVRFYEVDSDILYVYARDEDAAAEMEDEFALHISIIASKILDRQINVVLVLSRQLMNLNDSCPHPSLEQVDKVKPAICEPQLCVVRRNDGVGRRFLPR